MKSISILGCGWLGMPLGTELVKRGYKTCGSARAEAKLVEINSCGMEAVQIDLDKSNNNFKTFFDSEIIILNIPPSNAHSKKGYFDQLDVFLANIQPETHVLFVSSTAVYPSLNQVVLEHHASEFALSRSGISLLNAERKFKAKKHTIIRFGGLIDERRHPGKWFAGKSGLSGGNEPINMIHLQDCIGAILAIIKQELWGEVFNICHPDHPLKSEYYPVMASQLSMESPSYDPAKTKDWKVVSSNHFVDSSGYEFTKSIWEI